jgi:hypothetical protein
VALLVAAALLALLPESRIALPVATPDPRVAAGAIHVHSRRSDGSGSIDDIAAAAAAAGLQFVVVTDHGDGTRRPDAPRYVSGVLVLDGVEISSSGGHYLALDMPAAPYRLGGEAADVAADVARLGGLGIVAHPAAPKAELAWTDWTAPFDGVEWLNVDSEWRDESWMTLARAAATYVLRPAESIGVVLDRPRVLATLDQLAERRDILLLGTTDAHGGVGREGGRRLRFPSYESAFRALSVRAILRGDLRGDPTSDSRLIVEALRSRRVFTAIDSIAGPGKLSFAARTSRNDAEMGGRVAPGVPVTFTAQTNGPAGSTLVLLRDGRQVASAPAPSLEYVADGSTATYRVEVRMRQAPGDEPVPWLLSNAIRVGTAPELPPLPAVPASPIRVVLFEPGDRSHWSAERDPTSHAELSTAAGESPLTLTYSLGTNEAVSPYAAVVRDLPAGLAACHTLVLAMSAPSTARVSVQVREPGGSRPVEGRRWHRSVFVDREAQAVTLTFADLRPAPAAGRPQPDAVAIRTLMVVIDLVNARPGDRGSLRIHRAGCF